MTEPQIKDISRLLGRMPKAHQIKRDRIRALLLEDASKSNRAIAAALGVDRGAVSPVRADLERDGQISHYKFGPGGPGKGKVMLVHEARKGCCAGG